MNRRHREPLVVELLETIIEKLECLLHNRPDKRKLVQIAAFGEGRVQLMQNFSCTPGQNGTLGVTFTDANGKQHPLNAVPTAVLVDGGLSGVTVTPVGTQTPTDPSYNWAISVPPSANAGDAFTVHVDGVNPDGVTDDEDYVFTVLALDDTKQTATFA